MRVPKRLQGANDAIGRVSNPSKMPCWGYSIPAQVCKVGSRLRQVAGSTCESCYAMKGRYVMANVQAAMERRFRLVQRALRNTIARDKFVQSFATVLNESFQTHFRWHDSGDLIDVAHLELIADICRATPGVQHWLPTREYKTVTDYMDKHGPLPRNLVVRLSAHMINGKRPNIRGLPTSGVHSKGETPSGTACPAYQNDGHCGDCRMCWNVAMPHISYPRH